MNIRAVFHLSPKLLFEEGNDPGPIEPGMHHPKPQQRNRKIQMNIAPILPVQTKKYFEVPPAFS